MTVGDWVAIVALLLTTAGQCWSGWLNWRTTKAAESGALTARVDQLNRGIGPT